LSSAGSVVSTRLRQYAQNYLDQQAASLRAGGLYVTVEAQIGAPAAAIIEVAAWRKWSPDIPTKYGCDHNLWGS
jgi:hypothetical protein